MPLVRELIELTCRRTDSSAAHLRRRPIQHSLRQSYSSYINIDVLGMSILRLFLMTDSAINGLNPKPGNPFAQRDISALHSAPLLEYIHDIALNQSRRSKVVIDLSIHVRRALHPSHMADSTKRSGMASATTVPRDSGPTPCSVQSFISMIGTAPVS